MNIATTTENLRKNGFEVELVSTKEQALEFLKKSIPHGITLTTGGSQTLSQIGFNDYLKSGTSGWNNLKDAILLEKDKVKQAELRKQATLAQYYVGSVQAISQTGELVFASGTGSQIPSISFNADVILIVASVNKITPSLEEAMKRLRNHVVPLEDQRQKDAGNAGTLLSKILIYEKHTTFYGKRAVVIFVEEKLGY